MHVHVVPNRHSAPTVLLRESFREGSKVAKRTLANLSSLSAVQIEAIRAALRGEALQPLAQTFEITQSRSHGHVQGVALAMQRLGVAALLGAKSCRERELELVLAIAFSINAGVVRVLRSFLSIMRSTKSRGAAKKPTRQLGARILANPLT